MKAVMYHYVRKFDEKHPNFRFLDIENFRRQLDFFESNYGFVGQEDWNSFIHGHGMKESKGKVLLTFDDAMSCHYDYVFPELKERGLWGLFYVPTMPYSENKMLDVHRIHLLCGAFNGEDLLDSLLELVSEEMVPDSKRQEFRDMTYKSQDNYKGINEFKRILNYFIDYSYREWVIDKMASKFNYIFDGESFYVAPGDLLVMKENGQVIGSHTVSHPVMSKLSYFEQAVQIRQSFKCLEDIGCLTEKTYCHPYGGFHSFNRDTTHILSETGVKYSFNVESRDIEEADYNTSRQYLPRYDCNEFPHGAAS